MSASILQVFEEFQKARTTFVQKVADLATRPQNIEALQDAGVMRLLRPLLLDIVPSIQQSSALALLDGARRPITSASMEHTSLPNAACSSLRCFQTKWWNHAAAAPLNLPQPKPGMWPVSATPTMPLLRCAHRRAHWRFMYVQDGAVRENAE